MMSESMSEQNPKNHTDLMWQTHMQTLMRRKKNMEVAQTIDKAINDYYDEKGLPTPNWKQKRNPDWWTEYLIRLGLDPKNP
jgi:hypothetical protein